MTAMLDETETTTLVHTFFALNALEHDLQATTIWVEDPDDAPQPGDDASLDDWPDADFGRGETRVTYLLVPCTGWGDYTGTTWERANFEALLRDYPATFVVRTGSHDFQELLLPFTAQIDETLVEYMACHEYHLYDEEYHWELEARLVMEWWNENGFDGEFKYTLQGILSGEESRDTVWGDFHVTDDWLQDMFWRLIRTCDDWQITETATESYIRNSVIEKIAGTIADQIVADWNARVTWLADRQEGLFG